MSKSVFSQTNATWEFTTENDETFSIIANSIDYYYEFNGVNNVPLTVHDTGNLIDLLWEVNRWLVNRGEEEVNG